MREDGADTPRPTANTASVSYRRLSSQLHSSPAALTTPSMGCWVFMEREAAFGCPTRKNSVFLLWHEATHVQGIENTLFETFLHSQQEKRKKVNLLANEGLIIWKKGLLSPRPTELGMGPCTLAVSTVLGTWAVMTCLPGRSHGRPSLSLDSMAPTSEKTLRTSTAEAFLQDVLCVPPLSFVSDEAGNMVLAYSAEDTAQTVTAQQHT